MIPFASLLYAAYNAGGDPATANKNFRGDPCPAWGDLPENVRAKWEAVAAYSSDQSFVSDGIDFGHALAALKAGHRVRRAGWNDKGMWLALTPAAAFELWQARGAAKHIADDFRARGAVENTSMTTGAHIDMRAADGSLVIGWLASQTDMLANDWQVVS